jgi:hypothetical protein
MGWAIRTFTHSQFDHAFVVVDNDGTIVEADPRGASVAHISKYNHLQMYVSQTILTNEERDAIAQNAMDCVGIGYGFLDIICLALVQFKLPYKILFRYVLSQKRMICSQLVAYSGVTAGVTSWLCGKPYAQLVTPADLALLRLEQMRRQPKILIKRG